MAGRTYVPGLRLVTDALRRYISRYSKQITNNTSAFLWALAELLLDIADVLLAVISAQTVSDGQYDPDVPMDTSPYINQINGAVSKFLDAVGGGA